MYDAIGGHEEQLARVLELTRSARESAQAGDWSLVVALESERRPLVRGLFAQPLTPEARVRLVAAIREILASDAGLIALAAAGRNETAEESRKVRRGRKAAEAYAAAGKPNARNLPRVGKELPRASAAMARND